VRFYEGVDGLKTGYTQNAGYCLTATAKKNNIKLISVVMGEESIENRSQDTVKLLNYGFNTYKVNVIKSKKDILGKVRVEKGKEEYTNLILVNDAVELMKTSDSASDYKFELTIDKVVAPVKKGKVVGQVKIYNSENKLLSTADITVTKDVIKASIFDLFFRNLEKLVAF